MADNVTINITENNEPVTIDVIEAVTDVTITVSQIGEQGANGVGVPVGGTTGQILKKNSNTNYDTGWANESGAVGVNTYIQDTDPAPAGVNYAWWETSGGNLVTLWINIV
jgi:hypothetical protein